MMLFRISDCGLRIGATIAMLTWVAAVCSAQHCYFDPRTNQRVCNLPALGRKPATDFNPQSEIRNPKSLDPSAHCRIYVGDGSTGSGTLIAKNQSTGLVLTCSHLFDTAAANIVTVFPNGRRYGARLIERDAANDLAALLIRRPEAMPIEVCDDQPVGVLTACGYGGDGAFRPASGPIVGAVQAVGATYPSLKIGSAVRPGDSGGGVLDEAGRLVGVVWGCRDGQTYLTCCQPLRNFLDRVWQGRHRAGRRAPSVADGRAPIGVEDDPAREPIFDWRAWRTHVDARLAALDADKSTLADRLEQKLAAASPGLFSGVSFGKLLVGALGLSGPMALAVVVASGVVGRRVKRSIAETRGPTIRRGGGRCPRPGSHTTVPIAIDTPPLPQRTVPESHYVPVERDDFARAHQWAREQVARKYPGATEVLTTLESLIRQQLTASK
jgi:hypothetical protein